MVNEIIKSMSCLIGSNCLVSTPDVFTICRNGWAKSESDEYTDIKLVQDETDINTLPIGKYNIIDPMEDFIIGTIWKIDFNSAVISGLMLIAQDGLIYYASKADNKAYNKVDSKWVEN